MVRSVTEPVHGEACHVLQKVSTILGEKKRACRNIIFFIFYVFTINFDKYFSQISEKNCDDWQKFRL
jgi:hypothetical protein